MSLSIKHCWGFNGTLPHSLVAVHDKLFYVSGGTLIDSDLSFEVQNFYRGHDNNITAIDCSPDGLTAATGCDGYNSDICVWDIYHKSLLYRLSEHDNTISSLSFSDDCRFLVSTGGIHSISDGHFYVWDIKTGCYVTSGSCDLPSVLAVKWADRVLDIKGRKTDLFQFIVIGESGARLIVFDPQSGDVMEVIKPSLGTFHRQFTGSIAFSADYHNVYLGTSSGDVCVFSIKTRTFTLTSVVPVTSGGVSSLLAQPRGFLAGGGNGNIVGIEFNGSQEKNAIKVLSQKVGSSVTSMNDCDGKLIIGCSSGTIYALRMTQRDTRGCFGLLTEKKLENHNQAVSSVVYKESGQVYSLSDDLTLRCWNSRDFSCMSTGYIRSSYCGASLSLAVGSVLAFAGHEDGQIRCFDAERGGDMLWSLSTSQSAVNSVKLFKNERYFMTGTGDGCVRTWDVRKQSLMTQFKNHRQSVSDVSLINNDAYAISVSKDSYLNVTDLSSQAKISSFKASGPLTRCSVSRNERVVYGTSSDGSLTVFDLSVRDPVHVINIDNKPSLTCVDLSSSGDLLAVGANDSLVYLLDTRNMQQVVAGLGHSATVRDVAFGRSQLISCGNDSAVTLWDV
ncbi:hypothetical protein GEMRC1_008566 [Eukaryota sp. GEM-RC1]